MGAQSETVKYAHSEQGFIFLLFHCSEETEEGQPNNNTEHHKYSWFVALEARLKRPPWPMPGPQPESPHRPWVALPGGDTGTRRKAV